MSPPGSPAFAATASTELSEQSPEHPSERLQYPTAITIIVVALVVVMTVTVTVTMTMPVNSHCRCLQASNLVLLYDAPRFCAVAGKLSSC